MCVMYNNTIFFNFLFMSAFFKLSKFNVIKGKYIRVNSYVYKKNILPNRIHQRFPHWHTTK